MTPEKKKEKKAWLLLSILIMGAVGYFFSGQLFPRQERVKLEDVKMGKNVGFISKDPALNFTFEYPEKGWSHQESQGRKEKYNVVYLRGPVDADEKFTTLIEVVVKPLEKEIPPSDLLDAFLKMMTDWPKFRVIRMREMVIGGEKAFSAVYESEAWLPIESPDAKPAMVEEQAIFMIKNGKSYRFSFHALADRWDDYLPAFEHLLETFKIKD